MFNPSTAEPDTEWFEVYSTASSPRTLSGLTVRDGSSHTHVLPPTPSLILAPRTYSLLVRNRAAAVSSAHLPPAAIIAEYDSLALTNSPSGALSILDGTTVVATVSFGNFALSGSGKTLQFKGLAYASQGTKASWCLGQTKWPAAADYGTPGAVGNCP